MLFLPLLSLFFYPPCCQRSFFPLEFPASLILLQEFCLEERRTEGTWNAIACHPTMLSLTCPFLQQGLGWALPADPIV